MLEKLKKRAWDIVYNNSYIAFIGNTTKIYERDNLQKEIISVKSRFAFWGEFISGSVVLVKSAYGVYYFVDLSTLSITKIKPKLYISSNTDPMVDVASKVIYDFTYNKCINTLIKINYDGTIKKLFTMPVYGTTRIQSIENNLITLINERGVNEVKDRILFEIRKYVFDLKEEKVVDEKITLTPLEPLCFADNFILYENGEVSDYNGNMSEELFIPKCFTEGYPEIVSYFKKFEKNKFFISNSEELGLFDIENKDNSARFQINHVVNVIHYEDKLLMCTWENVYSIPYDEVFPHIK